jgi:hypothetical protein
MKFPPGFNKPRTISDQLFIALFVCKAITHDELVQLANKFECETAQHKAEWMTAIGIYTGSLFQYDIVSFN